MVERGQHTYLLDGDNLRQGLCRDLGFSDADRQEIFRRVAEAARMLTDAGLLMITTVISPFKRDRELARELIGDANFIEVFINTPIEECERRDPKGLHGKARAGLITNLTGLASAYEQPQNPQVTINTLTRDLHSAAHQLLARHSCASETRAKVPSNTEQRTGSPNPMRSTTKMLQRETK